MGNFYRSMGSRATVLDLAFGGLAATRKHQYQRRNIDLCDYHRLNYFAILVPEMGLFSKKPISIAIEASN